MDYSNIFSFTKQLVDPNLASMTNAFTAFQVITSICIIILSTPQLIKVLREKRTGNISFLSFWIYHYGIMSWIILAAFAPGNAYEATLIAECITICIDGALMICLHWFKKELARKYVYTAIAFVILNWILAFTFLGIHFGVLDARFSATAAGVLSLIFPAGVMLPFVPQFIKSIKTKQWQAVSYWLFALGVINNISWVIFFSLGIRISVLEHPGTDAYLDLLGGLIWQCIGFAIFTTQLGFTLHDRIDRKKNPHKYEMSPIMPVEIISENI